LNLCSYLAGLHKLNLIENIDYIAGISGGSWATAVYTYAQWEVDDNTLLGPIIPPSNITYENINIMDEHCARKVTNPPGNITDYRSMEATSFTWLDAWIESVSKIYLEPCGIHRGVGFSWNEESLSAILKRNPYFAEHNISFVLPRSETYSQLASSLNIAKRPMPIFAWTLTGPSEFAPFLPSNRSYTLGESTSIASGVLYTQNIQYFSDDADHSFSAEYIMGGPVESFAYGTCCAASSSVPKGIDTALLSIPVSQCNCAPSPYSSNSSIDQEGFGIFDIAAAVGMSSFAQGCFQEV
jgi:hypothetical protein